MKKNLKQFIKEHAPRPLIDTLLKARSAIRNRKYLNQRTCDVFSDIHRNHSWGGESLSGMGSDLGQTASVRKSLPDLIRRFGIRSFLDLPCGDFHWMQHVDLAGCDYTGADIVPSLIDENNSRYASANRRFVVLDLIRDPLPTADLLMCRDCLIHLPLAAAQEAVANIRKSGITYLLTTTYSHVGHNGDIVMGDFRAINLRIQPFCFPEPLAVIQEDLFEGHEKNPNFVRELSLWRVDQLG